MSKAMQGSERYLETAKRLAEEHRSRDPKTSKIFLDADPKEYEIRLLEVSSAVPSSGELVPFRFYARPDLGIDYPSVVVLVGVGDWDDVLADRLPLPEGWHRERWLAL